MPSLVELVEHVLSILAEQFIVAHEVGDAVCVKKLFAPGNTCRYGYGIRVRFLTKVLPMELHSAPVIWSKYTHAI